MMLTKTSTASGLHESVKDSASSSRQNTVSAAEEAALHQTISSLLALDLPGNVEKEITKIEHLHQQDTWDCGKNIPISKWIV